MIRRAAAAVLAAAVLGAAPAAAVRPAAGGAPLLAAAESAPATVVGAVRAPRRLDAHGYAAELVVEQSVAGSLAPGARVPIAWEELSSRRPPRFQDGDRIAAALIPLPGDSIWIQRFTNPGERTAVRAVAAAGNAFVRDPDAASVKLLAAYLALTPPARADRPGVSALIELIAGAAEPLDAAALARLEAVSDLAAKLDAATGKRLVGIVSDRKRPVALRAAVVALAGRRKLTNLAPALEKLATPGAPLEADLVAALAEIQGGMAPERAAALLGRDVPALRAVAARYAPPALVVERLPALVRSDPAPEVRAAAADALAARGGEVGLAAARAALADNDQLVRRRAALALGHRGAAGVAALRSVVDSRPLREAQAAILGLSVAGAEGKQALRAIAAGHRDEQIRQLAEISLGQLPGHHH